MTSKPVAFLLADLGVLKTHNRPYTSTDNPYSEAHFKTLKYRPEFPDRFEKIEHARAFCRRLLRLVQPPAPPLRDRPDDPRRRPPRPREGAPRRAPARPRTPPTPRHPSDSSAGHPRPPALPTAVWINKPPHRGGCSLNSTTKCLKRLDRLRPAYERDETTERRTHTRPGSAEPGAERQRTADDLKTSERPYEHMFANAPDGSRRTRSDLTDQRSAGIRAGRYLTDRCSRHRRCCRDWSPQSR